MMITLSSPRALDTTYRPLEPLYGKSYSLKSKRSKEKVIKWHFTLLECLTLPSSSSSAPWPLSEIEHAKVVDALKLDLSLFLPYSPWIFPTWAGSSTLVPPASTSCRRTSTSTARGRPRPPPRPPRRPRPAGQSTPLLVTSPRWIAKTVVSLVCLCTHAALPSHSAWTFEKGPSILDSGLLCSLQSGTATTCY